MYLIPLIIVVTLLLGLLKGKNVYDCFVSGIKESISLTISLLPYLASIFILLNLLEKCNLNTYLSKLLSTPLSYLGIPNELSELLILRPISGSGSLASVENIYKTYGVDSYVGLCASVLIASSDTVLYIVSVYLSKSKDKDSGHAISICMISYLFGTILTCFICRFL